jgi:hypothetical protein
MEVLNMIYVVKHSDDNFIPLTDGYKIIGVGDKFEDNGRDNINYLNPYINETTALYDIWKNCNEEVVGLVHYRRLFTYIDNNGYFYNLPIDIATNIVNQNKIICTHYHDLARNTIYSYLKYSFQVSSPHVIKTYDKYINKLESIDNNIIKYFETNNKFIARNMFVARKEIIDKYCQWLFSFIIPLTEEFIMKDLGELSGQERMLGYFVERIFSYWLECIYGKEKLTHLYYITYVNSIE